MAELPKRISFFWGNRRMTWMRYLTLQSFRHHHPDWDMRLYRYQMNPRSRPWQTNERQDFHMLSGSGYNDYMPLVESLGVRVIPWHPPVQVESPVHASDLLSWWVLAQDGGFYSDMDILFVRPIDELLQVNSDLENHATLCLYGEDVSAIGFMASTPLCRFFSDVLTEASNRIGREYQSGGRVALDALIRSRAKRSTINRNANAAERRIAGLGVTYSTTSFRNLAPEVVYPWQSHLIGHIFSARHEKLPARTVGIHWYAGHPVAQEANATLTVNNYRSKPINTFTFHVRRLLGHD